MGTVTKALSLLRQFNRASAAIGLSELARRSGMNKATVYRLMSDMTAAGLVEQAADGRAYRLGPEVLRLAAIREATTPFLSIARDVLRELSAATGETAHVSVLEGTRLTALDFHYSDRYATRVMMENESDLAIHATGSGLAVMAFSPPALSDAVLSAPLARFTPLTETYPAQIRAQLVQIHSQGYAESVGGYEADVHSHAAPIFGPDQRPCGAIAVAAPASRMDNAARAAIRREITAAAVEMTRRTGGFCPPAYPITAAA
ncbi:MAG: IclR family transcriptional regulator [Pseudomonadota bacterium]